MEDDCICSTEETNVESRTEKENELGESSKRIKVKGKNCE